METTWADAYAAAGFSEPEPPSDRPPPCAAQHRPGRPCYPCIRRLERELGIGQPPPPPRTFCTCPEPDDQRLRTLDGGTVLRWCGACGQALPLCSAPPEAQQSRLRRPGWSSGRAPHLRPAAA